MKNTFIPMDRAWRDPSRVIASWPHEGPVPSSLLSWRTSGDWWGLLGSLGIRLLVTREYEHLVLCLGCREDASPSVSYLPLPHPSGIAVDRVHRTLTVAATRNPNQLVEIRPTAGFLSREDLDGPVPRSGLLVPVQSTFYPGCMYFHDLAYIGGRLYANAVGHNAVVEIDRQGGFDYAWWPCCVDESGSPRSERNYIQLNSIAAGESLDSSFFTASAEKISRRRPGHRNFPVNRRGVLFSGRTREALCRGLTRPHSARLLDDHAWLLDSGYGSLGRVEQGRFTIVQRFDGWTRGLCFVDNLAFVGSSRVLPRFHNYAPGLDPTRARCGLHAVDTLTGRIRASLYWPEGNQVFAVDWIPEDWAEGFPFRTGQGRRPRAEVSRIFYSFRLPDPEEREKNDE